MAPSSPSDGASIKPRAHHPATVVLSHWSGTLTDCRDDPNPSDNQYHRCTGNPTASVTNYADGHWTLTFQIEHNPGDSRDFYVCWRAGATGCDSGTSHPKFGPLHAAEGAYGYEWSGSLPGSYQGGLRLVDDVYYGITATLPAPS